MNINIGLIAFSVIFFLTNSSDAQIMHQQLYEHYPEYQEKTITHRRYKHADIVPLIEALRSRKGFGVSEAGKSYQGRSIYQVKLGNGPTKVLLWSQMHGDEPTATMAIMDIFNFFSQSDVFDPLRKKILSELTLYFIPLLNPDGAEQFKRRTALDIDMNRDALRTVTPEGKILKDAVFRLRPDFGFNLHDQSIYYSAGNSDQTATFSFLAPAYNYEKTVNQTRGAAMKLIVLLDRLIQDYLPGQVAKYDDAFEPRAFGDNIQKWGVSTILIESGGLKDDPEKQKMRRIHFVMLLQAFEQIAERAYEKENIQDYYHIPENDRLFFDLIIREAQLQDEGRKAIIDLGFRKSEISTGKKSFYNSRQIADLGDLSIFKGYNELEANGLTIVKGEVYPTVFETYKDLRQENLYQLVDRGFTNFQLRTLPPQALMANLPVRLQLPETKTSNAIRYGGNPNFFLHSDGVIRYVVSNGQLFDMEQLRDFQWPDSEVYKKKP